MKTTGPNDARTAKYKERVVALLAAIDVGTEIQSRSWDPEYTAEQRAEIVGQLAQLRAMVANPEQPFRNLKSLRYLEDAFFTYWNEANGLHVEEFWARLGTLGSPFVRQDHLRDVLAAGRITNRHQYDAVQDNLVLWEQLRRISSEEARVLSTLLGRFEHERSRPKTRGR
jgi:hypothetical protein